MKPMIAASDASTSDGTTIVHGISCGGSVRDGSGAGVP